MTTAVSRVFWRRPVFLAWCVLLVLETLCQIALKLAGEYTGPFDFSAQAIATALTSGWLWTAIGCYAGAFLAWMTILRKSRLSRAFPTSAIVFLAVMSASWLVFGESISWPKALGAGTIVLGILLLGSDPPEQALAANPSEDQQSDA